MIYNNWDKIYKQGNSIRRWPSEDVVKFCSMLGGTNDFLLDLGAGTGRNLVPLMLSLKDKGILMAVDIAKEGIKNIEKWCIGIGSEKISKDLLPSYEVEKFEYYGIDFRYDTIYSIPLDRFIGFNIKNQLKDIEIGKNIYLILRIGSMDNIKIRSKVVDGFINRGSIFYMDKKEIDVTISRVHSIVKSGGKGLISFKSTKDSRYSNDLLTERINDSERILIKGPQAGMKMVFYNQDDIKNVLKDFEIIAMKHYMETIINFNQDINRLTLADYIAYVQVK